jgi:hypothetical protein
MPEYSEHLNDDSPYCLADGLLYSTALPYRYATDNPRLVIPPQLRDHVISCAHQEVGHMALMKTMRKIQEAFVWPSMKRHIQEWISKCPTCLVNSKIPSKAPMGEMPIATAPMQIIACDLIGPLIKSPQGNSYILTIVDHCTGWAEAYPIPNKTSQAVWNQFSRHYFPRNGYCKVLLTDRGLEFNSQAFTQYLQALGIEHRRTTPYNPQTNGKCEKFNGVLKSIITKLINNSRASWEDQLGPATMAYNNAVSSVTGHTPYFLHYARPLCWLKSKHGAALDNTCADKPNCYCQLLEMIV